MTGGADAYQGLLVSGRFPELEEALCERVRELKDGRPFAPVTIVVGSAAVRTRVTDLLVRRLGAVANIHVVTLAGLARDLFAATEGTPPVVLAGLARERLVRRLVDHHSGELAYFGPVAERPHFAQAVAATFADLREACVDPDSAWAEAVAAGSPAPVATAARAKAADLDRLYRAYCVELERRGLLDGAGVPVVAAHAVSGLPGAGASILYGIYDLNMAQERLFVALVERGADVFVPVPRATDGGGAAFEVAARFGFGERRLEPPPESRDCERVSAVWSPPVPPDASVRFAGDGSFTVFSVSDERAELREAVRGVMAAIEEGASSWDCAVVVPHHDDADLAGAALRGAGLPVACRLPDRSSGPRLLTRLADCVAPPAGEPFARRAVIDLLTAAPLEGMEEGTETSLWLDEARQAGVIAGSEQWAERLGRRRSGLERRLSGLEARGAATEAGDDEVSDKAAAVRLRLAAARTLETAARTLVSACAGLPERASWTGWAEALGRAAGAVFAAGAAAEAKDAASRLTTLSVLDEEVELAEVAAALRELLAGARTPVGRVGRDGVAVLTPLEMRGLRFHTVVFTGLVEGGFPARGRPDPLLGDAERRRISAAQSVRLPLAERRDAESLLLFAFACEGARERLAFLAPRSSASDGRPRLPSRLLLRLASLADGRPVGLDSFLEGGPLRPVWRRVAGAPAFAGGQVWIDERERDIAALLALSEHGRRAAAQAYVADALGGEGAAQRRVGAWRASRSFAPGAWDGLLGVEAGAALKTRHPFDAEMHPTRLERYIGCPFAFLLRDVFDLQAPDEPEDALEMDPKEFGTLAHEILQRAYGRVMTEDLSLDGALAAVGAAWSDCCADAERRGITGAALSWEVRREMLLEDLLESVRRDPVFSHPDSRPAGVEWRFGDAVDRPVTLELPGGRPVKFAGRLDRVDVTPAGARVIDYKSGSGGTERVRIKERLGVQLPVYRLALRQAGEHDYASITCLYRLVTRRGGFEDLDLPQGEEASERRLRALVAEAVALVDAGMFPRTTRQRCDYCDVRYACGVSAWARARKREHELLGPVVRMQSPPSEDEADDD